MYNHMWVFTTFDLPVKTKNEKKAYSHFKNTLLRLGFSRLQYSVYVESVSSRREDFVLRGRIRREIPEKGEVRIFSLTDTQFKKMGVFIGNHQRSPESPTNQFLFEWG